MVKRIIAGPKSVYICDECINVCNSIIENESYEEDLGYEDVSVDEIPTPAEIKKILEISDIIIINMTQKLKIINELMKYYIYIQTLTMNCTLTNK